MLINKAHVRAFALAMSKERRNGRFKRVSQEFLDKIEAQLKVNVSAAVRTHPSLGVTLK